MTFVHISDLYIAFSVWSTEKWIGTGHQAKSHSKL